MMKEPQLDHDFLYDAYRLLHKKGQTPRRENLAGMIGTVFRLASSTMIFTADVMANYGLIVPKNRVLGSADSLTDYFKVANRISFIDYFNDFLYPYSQSRNPGLTKEALIEGTSLRSIEPYLRNTPKIILMDNEDDLILTPARHGLFKGRVRRPREDIPARRSPRQHDVQGQCRLHDQFLQELKGLTPMKRALCLMLLTAFIFLAGCGTAPVRKEPEIPAKYPVSQYVKPDATYAIDAYDPWEPMNRRIYNFNAIFDNVIFLPVVSAYEFVLPVFVQKGITNFFNNLTEVTNLTNSLLQFKFVKAVNTFGRICINTTVGLGGLIDVATLNDGITREDEDFGQTLGFYGLGPGPYLVLPILGPSNVRDTTGLVVDSVVYSMMIGQLIGRLGHGRHPGERSELQSHGCVRDRQALQRTVPLFQDRVRV